MPRNSKQAEIKVSLELWKQTQVSLASPSTGLLGQDAVQNALHCRASWDSHASCVALRWATPRGIWKALVMPAEFWCLLAYVLVSLAHFFCSLKVTQDLQKHRCRDGSLAGLRTVHHASKIYIRTEERIGKERAPSVPKLGL